MGLPDMGERPTRDLQAHNLRRVRDEYVAGRIDVEEFEQLTGKLLVGEVPAVHFLSPFPDPTVVTRW